MSLSARLLCFTLLAHSQGLTLRANGEAAEERGGNIYFHDDKDTIPKRLTDSGRDRSPALSPDSSRIVFVRDLLGGRDYNDLSSGASTRRVMQLWVVYVKGNEAPTLVLDSPIKIMGRQFSGFYVPQFSSDNKLIYFLVQF